MTWLERNRVGYVFGLAGNQVLLTRVAARAEDAALALALGEAEKVRRFIVTNLKGAPRWLYEAVYCARGQAENLIKAHKLHLASDRRSCTSATANQFRLLIHSRLLAPAHAARPGAQDLVLA